eukprot:933523-Amphidinium_carterae.2
MAHLDITGLHVGNSVATLLDFWQRALCGQCNSMQYGSRRATSVAYHLGRHNIVPPSPDCSTTTADEVCLSEQSTYECRKLTSEYGKALRV